MASTASQLVSASHFSFQRFKSFSPVFDSVSLVLLPSLIALIVSAAFVGHGHISGDSILEVLNAMAQASSSAIAAP